MESCKWKALVVAECSQRELAWPDASYGLLCRFLTALLGVMGESDPAVTGMAMQYAFQVIWGLAFFVMNVTDVEAQAVSLERIHQYSILSPEEPELLPLPPPTWPQTGEIEWQQMGLRYRKGLPPALRSVTCLIKDGEKVGVCGRTGVRDTHLSNFNPRHSCTTLIRARRNSCYKCTVSCDTN